jgi:hypothetical protein
MKRTLSGTPSQYEVGAAGMSALPPDELLT